MVNTPYLCTSSLSSSPLGPDSSVSFLRLAFFLECSSLRSAPFFLFLLLPKSFNVRLVSDKHSSSTKQSEDTCCFCFFASPPTENRGCIHYVVHKTTTVLRLSQTQTCPRTQNEICYKQTTSQSLIEVHISGNFIRINYQFLYLDVCRLYRRVE